MRIAILSDIHGNLTALEAVIHDLRETSPDLVWHGGDLADAGSSPAEVVDLVRSLGWEGVKGNTDEMLSQPDSLEAFASTSQAPAALWTAIREMAAFTRERLGTERILWLKHLQTLKNTSEVALVHATPSDLWRAPGAHATEEELFKVYGTAGRSTVVYGHIHISFIRALNGTPRLLINCGSVGLPYDGDPRASYLLLDEERPSIRRVEYDVAREVRRLSSSGLPHHDWTARMLGSAKPCLP